MPAEIRVLEHERFAEWRGVTRRGFGNIPTPEHVERRRRLMEMDRCFAAIDEGSIVGTGCAHSFRMTVPGGGSVRTAGIASITTAATHTRRGIMTSMMRTLIDQARERGEVAAALRPSESSIYGRFGFGPATFAEELLIRTREARLRPGPAAAGKDRYVDVPTARKLLPAVWDRVRPLRPGWLDRSPEWWDYLHFDAEVAGVNGPFIVVSGNKADCDGYAIYQTDRTGAHGDLQVRVLELVVVSDSTRRALWRLILGIDLAASVEFPSAPVDDPLWWMLVDPRRLERRAVDGLWVRLLDIASALSARSYAAEGRLTLEVVDEFDPASSGTFVLEATREGARCRSAGGPPDIVLGAEELGAAYLGATPLRTLARAGRIEERTTGAIELFDRMFTASPLPWCPHEF